MKFLRSARLCCALAAAAVYVLLQIGQLEAARAWADELMNLVRCSHARARTTSMLMAISMDMTRGMGMEGTLGTLGKVSSEMLPASSGARFGKPELC